MSVFDDISALLRMRDQQGMTPIPQGGSNYTPVTDDMYQAASVQPVDLQDVEGVTETDNTSQLPAPTSGHQAFANESDDIENMLGEYRKKPKDDFLDFVKLTLARSAMSQQPKFLNALAEGAGKATFDQMTLKKDADRDRLQAIKDTIDYRDKQKALALKEKDMANDQDYRNKYLDILGRKADAGKGTKITAALRKQGDDLIDTVVGITRGTNRAIKDGVDIDPSIRIAVHKKAEEYLKNGDNPADAYGTAIDEVIGPVEGLQKTTTKGTGWFGSGGHDYMTKPPLTPQEAAAELARRRRGQ
jgi:hypothetical protein